MISLTSLVSQHTLLHLVHNLSSCIFPLIIHLTVLLTAEAGTKYYSLLANLQLILFGV